MDFLLEFTFKLNQNIIFYQIKKQDVIKHLASVNIFILIIKFNIWKLIKSTGVDLNLQFPAGWEQAKEIKFAQGFNKPAPRDYVGVGPLTAPEAISVYNFTLSYNFSLVISYHTQGKIIYWQFQDYTPEISKDIVRAFSEVSGYSPEDTPLDSSFAGYKDWFIQNYSRPGFTVEAGEGENPLPISQFDEIYRDNIGILVLGMVL